jgi:hypothetical protein
MDSGRSVHTGPGLQIGTADAARGAATKFGGWRRERGRREHGSAKQSIPTLRCPRRRIRCSASHFPRTRGALRRMAFCAVHCSALVASAVSGGVSTPPDSAACPVPRPARRVAHAPMSTPECWGVLAVICAPNARVLSLANAPEIYCLTRTTSHRTSWRSLTREIGHHHDQDRAVLDVVRLSLRSTLWASALTTSARSS